MPAQINANWEVRVSSGISIGCSDRLQNGIMPRPARFSCFSIEPKPVSTFGNHGLDLTGTFSGF
ncbi:hypothetical protein [Mesorhizobium sp. ES1-4]|uniref:hypothetical protein n=1 Tax=Mesorhizobium sp. ES1-4 TaxID=2876627 RepID=UPI001CCF8DD3|nr:hypothetical protein [Mesorhizobium sp. ES1-4]MBZ9798031.1 hypothetical protein [Mesorhizobium sp. ES1-4]